MEQKRSYVGLIKFFILAFCIVAFCMIFTIQVSGIPVSYRYFYQYTLVDMWYDTFFTLSGKNPTNGIMSFIGYCFIGAAGILVLFSWICSLCKKRPAAFDVWITIFIFIGTILIALLPVFCKSNTSSGYFTTIAMYDGPICAIAFGGFAFILGCCVVCIERKDNIEKRKAKKQAKAESKAAKKKIKA